MKKYYKVALIAIMILILYGCAVKNITFTAQVEQLYEGGILVKTTESKSTGFDRAAVSFDENINIDFDLKAGQIIKINILPQIRESDPVQVTAVEIKLAEDTLENRYKKITHKEAKQIIDNNKDIIILDVRTIQEYNEARIKDALLIPDYELKQKAQTILNDKNKIILVYCRSGVRSAEAAKMLINMGYNKVYDIGGIIDWPYDVIE